jgi:hypothetical protein
MNRKNKEVEEELKIIRERERANTGRLGITVRNVAKDVVKASAGYYSEALL